MLERIISGGQTGADRAALDFAVRHRLPHGGWCPRGRIAEDGPIDPKYQLTETPRTEPEQRTEWNVRDSDGTVIFSFSEKVSGGSLKTVEFAQQYGKPLLHVIARPSQPAAGARLQQFVNKHRIRVLNVAGPKESEEPGIGEFVKQALTEAAQMG